MVDELCLTLFKLLETGLFLLEFTACTIFLDLIVAADIVLFVTHVILIFLFHLVVSHHFLQLPDLNLLNMLLFFLLSFNRPNHMLFFDL